MRISIQIALVSLFSCLLLASACSECGRDKVGADLHPARADSGLPSGLDLEQIGLGIDISKFKAAAAAFSGIDPSQAGKSITCQPQIELGVPDIDEEEILERRAARGQGIENCVVQMGKGRVSSPLVRVRGEFLDSRLVKLTFYFKSSELGSVSHELSRRFGQGRGITMEERSVLDGIPAALPALQQADAYSRRAARVGFDWVEASGVADKVREEMAEVEAASTPEEREAELGDLLFAVVNWSRWLGVDPEAALRQANARFGRRFRDVERIARERGLDMATLTIDELDVLWREAKLSDRS